MARRAGLDLLVSLSCAAVLLGSASVAAAQPQECEREDVEAARNLYIVADDAQEAGRLSDALDYYRRSYATCRISVALYNIGVVLRALGRHREARDTFARLLRVHPELRDDLRQTATVYQREEAERVAVLELAGIDPDLRPEVSFDGQPVADEGERPLQIETDAGAHSLIARIPEHQPFLWEGSLTDGQREVIQVQFDPIPVGEGGFDPIPLVLGLVAAAVVGAGVGVGYYLWDEARLRPLNPADRTVELMP